MSITIGGRALVLFLAVAAAACATTDTDVSEANLPEKIARATAPADHEAIAAFYEHQARAAGEAAQASLEARRRYERKPPGLFYPIGTTSGMLEHYDRLIEAYNRTAHEYRALADWHRQLAHAAASKDTAP